MQTQSTAPTPISAQVPLAIRVLKDSSGANSTPARILDGLLGNEQTQQASQLASKQIANGQRLDVRV